MDWFSSKEIHEKLTKVYENSASAVNKSVMAQFKCGRTVLEGDPQEGRSKADAVDILEERVRNILQGGFRICWMRIHGWDMDPPLPPWNQTAVEAVGGSTPKKRSLSYLPERCVWGCQKSFPLFSWFSTPRLPHPKKSKIFLSENESYCHSENFSPCTRIEPSHRKSNQPIKINDGRPRNYCMKIKFMR